MRGVVVPLLLTSMLVVPTGSAQVGSRPAERKPAAERSAAREYFTDLKLVNQFGEEMQLYSELLEGKTVVINTFFTSCTTACPVTNATMARIQDWLGPRLGTEAHLISITVDPRTDTPGRLLSYAERFKARPGWFFLTGSPEAVELALGKLGQWVEDKQTHKAIFIVGNEPTGLWKKAFGLAPAKELIPIVESVIDDQG